MEAFSEVTDIVSKKKGKTMLAVLFCCLLTDLPTETEQIKILADRYKCEREVVMPDGSRADLVTETHAIEVEWASKWKESISQATLYSIWTSKKPAVILLIGKDSAEAEKVAVLRCGLVCERLGIKLSVVKAEKKVAWSDLPKGSGSVWSVVDPLPQKQKAWKRVRDPIQIEGMIDDGYELVDP
jgi:hypothetical protein